MKTFQISFVLLLLVAQLNSASLSVREQLMQINSYWAYHPLCDKILDEKRVFDSDRELIQFHLRLVERTLRTQYSRLLNETQKKQRMHLLDVLHDYWAEGVFPKNTGHSVRTPYFIDVYGTACAVGQLIISSGYAEFALKISRENNNGYISELVLKYPQIKSWADANGFALDELAWIQPCYGPPVDTAGLRQPACHDAFNGYFCPDFSLLQGPLTKSFYKLIDTAWVPWQDMCGFYMFNWLRIGKYKWTVKDGLNTIHTYTAELVAPPAATVSLIKSGNFNACNGVITASVQGGVLPFTYYWSNRTVTTSVLTSVCEELVILSFTEGYYCPQYIEVQTSPLGLKKEVKDGFHISPNPVSDILQLRIDLATGAECKVAKVLNMLGELVFQAELHGDQTNLDLRQLELGLYFLQVDNSRMQRFVKE